MRHARHAGHERERERETDRQTEIEIINKTRKTNTTHHNREDIVNIH